MIREQSNDQELCRQCPALAQRQLTHVGRWSSDEITLHQITTGLTAAEKVDPRLDAFGYDAAAEFMGKLGDGTHE